MIPGFDIEPGPLTTEWTTLIDLADSRFDVAQDYFRACQRLYPGLDQRGQAAFFLGGLAYSAAGLLGWFELRGEPAPDLAGFGVRLNAAGDGLVYRIAEGEPAEINPGIAVTQALNPLLVRLQSEMRIGLRAQWRLVADSIAAAYSEIGESLGCAGPARERALALIAEGPTANPQTGYHRLTVDGDERHYLKRGGCCRWYTADEGEFCATCVLREPQDQIERLSRLS